MNTIQIIWIAAGAVVMALACLYLTVGGGLKHFINHDKK